MPTARNGDGPAPSGGLTPVLRRAMLLHLSPPPTEVQADGLVDTLSAEWDRVRSTYHQLVADAVGIAATGLSTVHGELVRRSLEGKTRIVDFPRVEGRLLGSIPFNTRVTFAICTEANMSSKA